MSYKIIDTHRIKELVVFTLQFQLPLSYTSASATIPVVARLVRKYEPSRASPSQQPTAASFPESLEALDVVVYLQGGPGFPCAPVLSNSSITKELIDRGFDILYVDQRGTGLSHPIEADLLQDYVKDTSTEAQLAYLMHFRADNIVHDCEAIRSQLGINKWSLLGQSYGGFCSVTYLSMFPQALKQVLITGGIPPINTTVDEVYTRTYLRTSERNERFYEKFPQNVEKVKQIAEYLASHTVTLPNGGNLSVERFQQLGIMFGATGGTDKLHQLVMKFAYDLDTFGKPTHSTLLAVEASHSFDSNVIYALFQEAIYMDGNFPTGASDWAADRLRAGKYVYSAKSPLFFTGEMVFKSMFDDYVELRKLKLLVYAIHANTKWSKLYDVAVLKTLRNQGEGENVVPVAAATYFHDQYVDFEVSMRSKALIGGIRQYITSEFFHNGLRDDPKKILDHLFMLVSGEVE
ncbi:hypothetical protein BABINDRAFT_159018 [Babjeviella inositovora NRRL Y-12698]|uniref:AB hydrolase-1 domain-containing protein n=1 Tax=Babjeviella inositovora NRRL Y-12698 TaxID=984486 RepID=A0A1E3QXN2_9ASCO|nr:uncharacterized protein BABINDRAFT_159018 [Babjeviella inositovora NRRL Y-12698]ODQ82423.1 hypothetical protein BABINDRAFT_159018 [Babjeviella inositovora NRRL Y-12698]